MILRVFYFMFIFSMTLGASDFKVVFNDSLSSYENFTLSYYEDTSNSLDIKEIQEATNFQKTQSSFSLGYKKSTLWLKFDIYNRSSYEDFVLTLNEHFYDNVVLYSFDHLSKSITTKKCGVLVPLNKREIQNSKISFELKSPQNSRQTIYLKLKAKYPYFGNIEIYKKNHILKSYILSINSFYIFMFGTLTIIILFNLFLGFHLKEKIYFFYVGYSICISYYLLNISGMLVYLNLQHYMYNTYFITAFAIVFLAFFSLEYLNAKKNLPKVIPYFKVLSSLIVINGLISIFYYTPFNKYLNNFILLTFLSLIFTSLYIYSKGYKKAKYYLFAILVYFSFVIVFLLLLTGSLEYNNFTRYGYLFTLYFEIVFFALMLAGRYNDIKNKQISTQNKFLTLKKNKNILLKEEVAKQTSKLNATNTKLTNLLSERELLLKEIFHRVKNNFHMINSMLWFESKKHKDKDIFTQLSNRINSMSKLHEHLLYSSKDLNSIETYEYFKELITSIESLYSNKNFSLEYNIENFSLQFEEALSLGVIINEIVNNSIKYAQNKEENKISLKLTKQKNIITLSIKDQGEGFAKEYKKGLGLNLVDDFSAKLENSHCKFSYEEGLVFKLNFTQAKSQHEK